MLPVSVDLVTETSEALPYLDARRAQSFSEPHQFGGDVSVNGSQLVLAICDLIAKKSNLLADFGELAENLFAQRIKPAAKTRDRFDHQVKARAEMLEQCADLCYAVVCQTGPLPYSTNLPKRETRSGKRLELSLSHDQ